MDEKIALYTLFNDNYFECGSNMIYSFIMNNKWFVDGGFDIIVIVDDKYCVLNEENKEKLRKFYKNLKFLEINHKTYQKVFDNQIGISHECDWCCFYKLELFKHNEYKRKLYLDSDIIVTQPIPELFQTENYLSACLDCLPTEAPFQRTNDLFYFNGGVYAMNDNIETKFTFDDIFVFCANTSKETLLKEQKSRLNGLAVDQDYLNLFIPDQLLTLIPSIKYNYYLGFGIDKASSGKIIHYYAPHNKPWDVSGYKIGHNRYFFLVYYETTYWKNKFLENYK